MTLIQDPLFDTGEMQILGEVHFVDDRQDEVDRLREFVWWVTEVFDTYTVINLESSLPVSSIKLNELACRVTATTFEVCHATIYDRRKFVLECRDTSQDCEEAASIWMRRFIDLLSSLSTDERADLLDVYGDAFKIRQALINPARPSSWGSTES